MLSDGQQVSGQKTETKAYNKLFNHLGSEVDTLQN